MQPLPFYSGLSKNVVRISVGGFVAIVLLSALLWQGFSSGLVTHLNWHVTEPLRGSANGLERPLEFSKPAGIKVIGLVFYGRRRFVEVLQCYLHQNLVDNGGILDEIVFEAKTDDSEDLAYLEKLLATSSRFRAEYPSQRGMDFSGMYAPCVQGTVCVKIDDDVLFIGNNTINSIVKTKLENPQFLAVSANLVGNFGTTWLHRHLGAIHPYLPELSPRQQEPSTWEVSNLPNWTGADDFDYEQFEPTTKNRWLPLSNDHPLHNKTPVERSEYTGFGRSEWNSWKLAAQLHYSFLQNLEDQELHKYNFGLWNLMYQRISINLFAITGDDIVKIGRMPADDELFLATEYPAKIERPFVIDGSALAVHHGYNWMTKHSDDDLRLEGTDLLQRYKLYAEQNICGK